MNLRLFRWAKREHPKAEGRDDLEIASGDKYSGPSRTSEFGPGQGSGSGKRSLRLVIDQLGQDLRYAVRMLARSPGFTCVAVISLALGVGANSAIFSVLDALMLKSLPVPSPQQLVLLKRGEDTVRSNNWLYRPWFENYRDLGDVFSGVSAVREGNRFDVMIDGPGGGLDGSKVRIELVSGNYFSMLGVKPVLGRTLSPDDDLAPGGHPVAVISNGFWNRRFAREPQVLNRVLALNGAAYTIVGVTAPGFSGDSIGQQTDVWFPIAMYGQVMADPGGLNAANVRIIARLRAGVSRSQGQAAAQVAQNRILTSIRTLTPQQIHNVGLDLPLVLEPAAQGYSPQRKLFAQPVLIVMVVVALVLLIACANVANLMLARSAARQREIGIRLALGASRSRIARQLLTEGILLAVFAGGFGLVFAAWAKNAIVKFMGSGPVVSVAFGFASIDLDLRTDARFFAFTAVICLIAGIMFAVVPALRLTRISSSQGLVERGSRQGTSAARMGPLRFLAIPQVAVLLVLLVCAGLFERTLANLRTLDLGFDTSRLLQVWTAPWQSTTTGPALVPIFQKAQERISSLPGVASVGVSTRGLLNGLEGNTAGSETLRVEGQPPKPGERLGRSLISPGFLSTVGIPLLDGRDFTDFDTDSSQFVAIINETMARFYFGDENPIGKRFGFGPDSGFPRQIVAVVRDAKYDTPREKTPMMFYLPYRQAGRFLSEMCVVVRTSGNPAAVAPGVRRALQDIDPTLPVLKINTIEEQIDDVLIKERMVTIVAGFLGLLALLLAGMGLYGVISYTVARRTNEIGIRMALGATPSNLLGMVVKDSLLLVLLGVAVGLPATLAMTRLASAMLFGIAAADPATIVLASLVMIVVGAVAGLLPALRASSVDPVEALRYE